jgi:hypothetical protein
MNYFAHGYRFLDDPYFLAGTAVPDWLSAVDRRVRVRPKEAEAHGEGIGLGGDREALPARVARGVARHHADDGWFHTTEAFAELSWRYTIRIRDILEPDDGMRPSFLGHILIEILLDSILIDENPGLLDAYYRAMSEVDPVLVEDAVNRMSTSPTERLSLFIPAFTRERFLCDYSDDHRLLRRLNQVMRRVGLSTLPEKFLEVLPDARRETADRRRELLPDHLMVTR